MLDPVALVATFARDLARYLILTIDDPVPGGEALSEPAFEMAAIYMGFGVFVANSSLRDVRYELNEGELVHALAMFCLLRMLPLESVDEYLNPHLRKYLRLAVRDLAQHEASFEKLRATSADTGLRRAHAAGPDELGAPGARRARLRGHAPPHLSSACWALPACTTHAAPTRIAFWDVPRRGVQLLQRAAAGRGVLPRAARLRRHLGTTHVQQVEVARAPEISCSAAWTSIARWCPRTWRRCAGCSIDAHAAGLRVVLVPLELPGARWVQQNDGKFDDRLWSDRALLGSVGRLLARPRRGAGQIIRRSRPTTSSTSRCRSGAADSTNTPRRKPCRPGINGRAAPRATCRRSTSC